MRWGIGMAAGVALVGAAAVTFAQATPNPAATPRAERVKAMFAQVDTNKDGFVSKPEAETARAALRTRMEAQRKERRDRAFARLDGDKNGQISRAEFDAAPRMAAMDGPRDGRAIRRMDRRGGMIGAMPLFERMDADKDGRVSLAEAEAWQPSRWAMRDGRRGGVRGHGALPPGHPPVAGAPAAPMSDAERPLGGGRD